MHENETIAHCLVLDKTNCGISDDVRASLGIFYKRNQFMDKIRKNPASSIMEETEDACMKIAGDDFSFDYLIMTWEGNIFSITDYHETCIEHIADLNKKTNDDWLVSGHLMDQFQNRIFYKDPDADKWKNCFWLYPITAIINLKKWRELGMPSWGNNDTNTKDLIKGIPSTEFIHDGYTPLSLTASTETTNVNVKKGWSIIDASLKAGLPIYNVSQHIRNNQTHLYPEVDGVKYDTFWKGIFNMPKMSDNYQKVFEKIISCKSPVRIDPKTWRLFIRNTEEYFPVLADEEKMPWNEIDTLILPSSGFKDFIVSMSNTSSRHPVQIIHFDILKNCVTLKKEINELWDGTKEGLIALLTSINSRYVSEFRKSIFHMNSMISYDEVYDDILMHFDSEDDVKECWLKFQKFNHHYIQADMLELDDSIQVRKLIQGKNVYICLSDIAGWRNNVLGYGYKNLRKGIINTINGLLAKGYNGLVDYKDPGTDIQHVQNLSVCVNYLENHIPKL
jgi:hypothetical protein